MTRELRPHTPALTILCAMASRNGAVDRMVHCGTVPVMHTCVLSQAAITGCQQGAWVSASRDPACMIPPWHRRLGLLSVRHVQDGVHLRPT